MLSNPLIDKDRCASLTSNYSKKITQYKFDLMNLHLDTMQTVIHGQQQLLNDLHDRLTQTCDRQLTYAIENRQQLMKERHEINLKHTLDSFFDEAPTTSNE